MKLCSVLYINQQFLRIDYCSNNIRLSHKTVESLYSLQNTGQTV